MISFFFNLAASRFVEFSDETLQHLNRYDKYVVYAYSSTTDENDFRILHRIADLYPQINVTGINCSTHLKVCRKFYLEPIPTINIFGSVRNKKVYLFYDEINFYNINRYVTYHFNLTSAYDNKVAPVILENNYTTFINEHKCTGLMFTNRGTLMSQIIANTINELYDIFYDDPEIGFGEVPCNLNVDFCAEINVTVAPILRVYKDNEIYLFKGTREIPYLLDFMNTKCGTYRDDERNINISLYFNPCEMKAIEQFKTDPRAAISSAANCRQGDPLLPMLNAARTKQSREAALKKCNELLGDKSIKGPSRDRVIATKWVLNELANAEGISSEL